MTLRDRWHHPNINTAASVQPALDRTLRRLDHVLGTAYPYREESMWPVFNVKSFGAKGDGTTDDTAAIQRAIDEAGASGSVFLPPGTYITTAPLLVDAITMTIFGPASSSLAGCSAIIQNEDTGPIITVEGSGNPTFTVAHLGFIGDENVAGGVGATVDGVELVGDSSGNLDSTVYNCSFLGIRRCISSQGRNLVVYDNTFANSQIGVYVDTPLGGANRAFKVKRNHFHGMGASGTDADIYVNHSAAVGIDVDNNYRDQGTKGKFFFSVSGIARVRIHGNHLDQMTNNGIELGSADNVSIVGNHIFGNGLGTSVTNARAITTGAMIGGRIGNNYIANVAHHGIAVSASSIAVSITSNTIIDAGQATANTYDAITVTTNAGSRGLIQDNHIACTSLTVRYGINGGAGWTVGPNFITNTGTALTNGTFDTGNPLQWVSVLSDGITAPATLSGVAQFYVDTADGDFKVRFGDGFTRTLGADS